MLILNKIDPLDLTSLGPLLAAPRNRVLVVEDHFGHSGLYSSLCQAVMELGLDCSVESAAPRPAFDLVVGASATYLRREDSTHLASCEEQSERAPRLTRLAMDIADRGAAIYGTSTSWPTFCRSSRSFSGATTRKSCRITSFLCRPEHSGERCPGGARLHTRIFAREQIDSVDWSVFERILLYVLVRHLRPTSCLETGVYYGGTRPFCWLPSSGTVTEGWYRSICRTRSFAKAGRAQTMSATPSSATPSFMTSTSTGLHRPRQAQGAVGTRARRQLARDTPATGAVRPVPARQ